jgi:hypothetical protein
MTNQTPFASPERQRLCAASSTRHFFHCAAISLLLAGTSSGVTVTIWEDQFTSISPDWTNDGADVTMMSQAYAAASDGFEANITPNSLGTHYNILDLPPAVVASIQVGDKLEISARSVWPTGSGTYLELVADDGSSSALLNWRFHDDVGNGTGFYKRNATIVALPRTTNAIYLGTRDNDLPLSFHGIDYIRIYGERAVGDPGWKVDADGNWTNAANWTGAVPNAVDAVATFGSAITAARTVTLDAPQTAGTILFNNNSAYTIGGSSTLTLDTSSGNTAISVSLGSHTISAPISANDNLDVSMPAASVLTLSGGVTGGPGLTLNKSGAGKLAISSLRTTNVNVNQGTIQIVTGRSSAKTSNVGSLVIAFGSTVDLGDNDMVLKATPIADVKNNLSNGYDSGLWTGIGMTSSVAAANTAATHKTALGYATASQLGVSTFSGQSVSGADVCVRYTYYGDANLDGKVNTSDFNQLAGSFGTTNKDWVNGDFNYDGAVNSQDFNALSGNYGMVQPASAALGSVVPEPATLSMVFAGFGVFMRRRRA